MKYILCAAALFSAGSLSAAGAAADANQIAFKFYGAEAAKPGNVFFSPYSMYTAFAMTYEGAKGQTATELASVFGYPADTAALRASAAGLKKSLAAASKGAEFTQANSFWMQKGYNFLPGYLQALKKFYAGEGKSADFRGRTEVARKDINAWTAARTGNKIKELFPADSLDALTRLVLVNAVYFKGAWQQPFKKDMTFEADFTKTGGEKVKAQMMSAPGTRDAGYTENDDFQAVRLPYKGGGLSMLVLLPREGKSPADLEKGLDGARLDEIRKSLNTEKVRVFLPKFSFSSGFKLNSALAGLGMPTAFTEQADFSGMNGQKSLYIQNAFHKAFVEVSEEGTEAAAATGVAMGLKSMPMGMLTFRANRPFLFFIEDPKSGLLLFMGRMEDPTKK
jgi:serpin B